MLDPSRQSIVATPTAGRVCAAGAAVLVAGAVATQIAQASTPVPDAWSYPWSSGTSIALADLTIHDTGAQIAGGLFGVGTIASAAGLLLAGRATLTAGVWTGRRRHVVILTGVAGVALLGLQFTKALPAAVGVFDVGFLLIGVALAAEPAPGVAPRGAEAVQGA